MVTILITRPLYDHTTQYLAQWSKKIIDLAKERGNQIVDLKNNRVTRKIFEDIVRKIQPKLVLFNGHGESDTILGQHDKPLVIAGENEDLLARRIIYSLSCKSAQIVGPKSIENGATANCHKLTRSIYDT